MTRRRLALAGTLLVLSTGVFVQACTTTEVVGVVISQVFVSPPTARVNEGDSLAFSAALWDDLGNPLPSGANVVWSSDDPTRASVTPDGVVRGLQRGDVDIRATFQGVTGTATVTVVVADGVTVSPLSGPTTEAGGQATFTVVLESAPLADVTIGVSSSDTGEGTVSTGSLIFTSVNWNAPQTVTVTGVDDALADGNVAYSIVTTATTSPDPSYDGLDVADVPVTNIDNETAGITVSPPSGPTTESGGQATFTVVLNSQPSANVTIGLSSSDVDEGTVAPASLTFTPANWNAAQTVTVTGVDDALADGNVVYSVLTAGATSTDAGYDGLDAADVSITNTDDETAGITVSPPSEPTTEAGGQATFTVVLNSLPSSDVTIALSSSDATEGTVSPTSLTFTSVNWNAPQTVTVTGVDDVIADGNVIYSIVTEAAASTDPRYSGLDAADVSITNTDNETAGITVSPPSGPTTEGGGQATFTVVLNSQPSANVTIGLTSSDATEGSVSPTSLTFTSASWNAAQTVTATGINDAIADGNVVYSIVTAAATSTDGSYNGLDAADVSITNTDNETAGITVSPPSGPTTEGGGQATFTVVLNSQPSANVSIGLTSSDTSEGTVSPTSLTFTGVNWNAAQTVTVAGVDDVIADGNVIYSIVTAAATSTDTNYTGLDAGDVSVTNTDDETAGITVSPPSGPTTEGGGQATFTVVLNSQPAADVTIGLTSSDPTEGTISPTSLTFTGVNWNAAQTVTVTGVDDAIADGNLVYSIVTSAATSTDPTYSGLDAADVSVTNNDNEAAGVTVSPPSGPTTEGGGQATFTVVLNSQPTADVSIGLSSSDATEGTISPASLTFTSGNWNATRTVTVTGVDDAIADGNVVYSVVTAAATSTDPTYNGLNAPDVSITNTDNETAGISISPPSGPTTEGGGQATFTLVLNSQPTADVSIGLTSSDVTEGAVSPASLTFTSVNWNSPQTVTATGIDDALADGNVVYSIVTAAATSTDPTYAGLNAADVPITNTDDETAGIAVSSPSGPTSEGGGQATFTVVLNSQPTANVSIALSSNDATEGVVSPTLLTFTPANWNGAQTVTVTGIDDALADGDVVYSIVTATATSTDGSYNGLNAADVSITNTDDETAGITVSPPSGPTTEGGGQATFTVGLNSQPSANVTIGLSSSDGTEGAVSPTSLTFTTANWNAAQTVTVTGADDALADGNVVYTIVTAAAASTDPSYSGLNAADVSITNNDDETAGITVSPPSGPTTEGGGQATFTVVLSSQPSANVTIELTSNDASEGTVSPASLTFTGVNWNAPQTVTVTGVDDAIADGNVAYSVVTAAATSTDPNYAGLNAADVSITNTDNEAAGITVSPPSGPTTEAGGQATFTVVLNSQPSANVAIAISSGDTGEGTVSPTSLTFTGANWNAAQTVTVTGVDDVIADGNVVYSIVTAPATSTDPDYNGLNAVDVSVTNNDNETAGITVSPPSGPTTEGGGQATFTVVLNSQPSANVTIGLTSSDVTEGAVSPAALTFTTANWNAAQTVTATGVDDAVADGNIVYSILTAAATSADANYTGLNAADVSITNNDDETAGITVSPPSGPTTEAGGQATFTVVLNSQPSANVTIGLSSSDTGEGTVSPTSLTFTAANWNAAQTVTVTGVEDALADGNVVYSIVTAPATSADGSYNGLNAVDVSITNNDNETAGVTVSPLSGPTTEAGGQATFTVVLNSQPTANVSIGLSSSDVTEGTISPTSLTFTTANWNAAQTVTVTGVDDAIADGNVVYSVVTAPTTSADGNYNGLDAADVSVTNTDNETAGITVSPPSGPTTESGGQATFTVVLNSQPSANVSIGLSSSDATEGSVSPTSLTFTTANWNAAQTVTVTGVDDALADGSVVYAVVTAPTTSADGTYNGLNAADVSVTNVDNETAGVTVSPLSGPTTEAGGQATFTVALNSQPTANVSVGLSSSDATEGTVSPASLTFTTANWNAAQTVTVTGVDDAIADGNVVYSVVTAPTTSADGNYNGLDAADVSVTNTDNETAGITVSPPSGPTTEAGGQATFTVVLNSQPSANVSIGLSSSDATEGSVSPTSLTFTTANWNAAQTVTVTGVDDAIADGDVVYSVVTAPTTSADGTYNGLDAADVSVTNTDNETAGITVSPPSGPTTEVGGQATFTVVLNSQPTANVAVGLSSSDPGEGTVSPASLTFTTANWNAAQTVTVTGVDDAIADGDVVYSILTAAATSTDPGYSGLNAADVAITNTDNEAAGITVSPPSGPTTEAGGQATFTVVLNSQPSANVTVGLSSSDTGEGTVTPASLTFTTANWNAAQTVTVTGVDDAIADGSVVYSIVTAPTTSADGNYNGLDAADVSVTNTDDETAGVTVSPPSGPTTEAGGQATFTVVLNSEPSANVTIGLSSNDATEGSVSPVSLTFTGVNWNAPQTVTVTGVDDATEDGDVAYSIVTAPTTSADGSYNGLNASDVSITNVDDETAGITVSPPSGPTTEAGGQATFTVVLNSQPSASVTIGISSNDATEGTVSPVSLTFTGVNWNAPQTVTVTGVDDATADGDVVYSIQTAPATSTDASYNGLDAVDVSVTNTDNEAAGITVSPPSGPTTEAGGQATFTVVLNSQPSASVTIGLSSSDTGEGTVSPTSLTFTTANWNAPQTVTATGVDDVIADGNVVYSIVTAAATSADGSYNGLDATDVSITNTDNETAGITVSPPSGPTTEAGGQATFTVVLNSQPSANVSIGLSSSDTGEGTVSPTSLTFTTANWNAAQTVTATGVDDAIADGNVVYSIATAPTTSADGSYNGLDAVDVSITNNDDEAVGITVSPPSGPTTEDGGQATFTVVLASQPAANVTIGLTSSDASEGSVSPATLTFTTANWNATQTVTATGVDDAIADGNIVYSIVTAAATSTDPGYNGLDGADVSITNVDNEAVGIIVSPPSGPTTEAGGQATFTVVLESAPTASVTIGISSNDATEGAVSPTSLTFTTVNWNAAQTVTATGVDDAIADGDVVYSIVTAPATSADAGYSGLDAADVSITNTDNETAGITVSSPSGPTTEAGGQATFTVVLNSQPSADVTIGLSSSDTTEGVVSLTSLTFTTANWNAARTVTAIGVDDALADGNVVYSIVTAAATSADPSYGGLDAADVSFTNVDNETAGITLSPLSGPTTEVGGQATFTVVLNSQPSANVAIGLSSSDATEGSVSPTSLTFTGVNWNAPQTVTVTGVDDAVADGNVVYSIVTAPATSADANYDGLDAADVSVTNTDNEAAGVTVSPPSGPTTEAGGQATFTVVLNSQPSANVTVAISSSDTGEGTVSPASLTFTTANWNAAQTVTATGVDDAIADGDVVYSIVTAPATSADAGYNGLDAVDVSITNTDDETAGITLSPLSGPTTEAGGQATFTVVLNSQPSANVTIGLSSSDTGEGTVSPTSLTFTTANWNAAQTVTVTGVDDAIADGNVVYSIVTAATASADGSYNGLDAPDVSITNTDNETAGITVSPPSGPTTEAGGQATFTVVLNSQPSADVTIALSSSDATEGSVSPASLTFTTANWNAAQTVTVTGVDDALADGDIVFAIVTATATSTDPGYSGLDAVDVSMTNTDNETAGITVSQPTGPTTEAGGQAMFTIVLNSQPSANVTIALSSSDATEGTVSPASLTFTTANWNAAQTVTATGVDDALADGNIVYSIVTAAAASTDPTYSGLDATDVSITNTDNEAAGITVSPPSGPTTEAGGQATFTVVLNSQPSANVTIGLSSSDATEGTVSPASLTFTTANWNATQTVTATGVDDAIADGNVVYSVVTAPTTSADASYNGLDASDVSVTNTDNETAGITVSPPSGPTTEAGGQATFTVVLNSQPSADVTIGLSSNDSGEGTVSPTSLTFTTANWNAPQTVSVTGTDDALADGDIVYAIVTATATSTDAGYNGLDAADVSITNTDNETAGITVSPPSGPTTEAGGQATFTVVLNSQPSANVTIALSSSDATEGSVSPASLTFTTGTWNAAQTVTVTGADDALADGNIVYSIVTAAATSTDPTYSGLDATDVSITNTDNEAAGITVSPPSGPTTEAGGQATFTVVLNSQPSADVTIGLSSSDATEGSVSPTSLTFTSANWNAAQTVTATGVDDAIADGNVVYSIVTAAAASTDPGYNGLDATDVSVTNTDNETAGITVSPPSGPTTEAGGQATFTVVLNSQPSGDVTIGLSSNDTGEGTASPTSLTFTGANWNAAQTVTVTGVDDALADGDVVFSVVTAAASSSDGSYNGLNAADVSITNTDNETAGISVSPPTGPTTEAGGQATFTVVLNSQPSADVTIGLSSNDATEGTVSPASLTFTTANWNAAQTVTATGVDDALADGNIVYSVVTAAATSTDPTYSGLDATDVSITNTDNETAGITVSQPSGPTTEAGGQATFTVVLNSQPSADVTIGLSSNDATEGTVSPASLTFTTANWNAAQTVTATGVDDAIADGNIVYSIVTAAATSTDPSYSGLDAADVSVTNVDNETAGITVSPLSGPTTEAGGQATFTVVLNSQPSADVTIGLASSDTGEGTVSPTSLTFTGANWNAAQTVTVTGVDDALADGDILYSVVTAAATSTDGSYNGLDAADVSVTNTDDESAGITVSPPSGPTTEAGGQGTFTVVLNSQPSADVTIGLSSNDTTEGTVSPASLTFTTANWNAAQTVTATGVDDAIADGNIVYSIVTAPATSTDPSYSGLDAADVSLTNTDNETAGITVSQPSGATTEAGGQATFTVVLNSQPSADVTIGLSSNDGTEGTVSPTSLTFTTANWNAAQTVTATGVDDAIADGNIVYSIVTAAATSTDPSYSGIDAADVSFTNVDNETAGITVSPLSGPTTEAGGQATFTVVLNSQPSANVSIGLSSSDTGEGTVSPTSLTFTGANWNAAQTVTVTGVDDALADGDVVYSVVTAAATSTDGSYNGLDAADVSITNTDDESAGITVSPPSGPTTEAGGQATFTVVLNSQPSADVTIGLSSNDATEGTVSPASLTFTSANWNAAQTVTATGVDDALADGSIVYSVVTAAAASTDPSYSGLDASDVSITNTDNETAGITVSPPSGPTTEAGGQATFTVILNSQPSANVTIGLSSSDTTEGTVSPTSLTFTSANWNAAQTVTTTGVDDAIADGNIVYSIVTAAATSTDPSYSGLDAADVSVTNVDNETAGITVSPPSGPTTEDGGQATFTVVLNSQPSANVSIGLTSNDTTEGTVSPTSLTFTGVNWNSPQTVTVTGVDDPIADGNVAYSIVTAPATSTDASYNGLDAADVSITNVDNSEVEGVTVSPPSGPTTEAGGQATFTVVLTSQPSANVVIGISSSDTSEGTASPTSLTFTTANWNAAQTVTVTGVDDALADGNIVYSIVTAAATSTDPGYNGLDAADVSFTNVDNETADISVSPPSGPTTEAGGQATFTVVLNSQPSADVTIGVSSSDTTEGTVSPTSLTFTNANWNAAQTVTATGVDDAIADGNVVYSIVTAAATSSDASYNGLDAADVSITNVDNDGAGITVSPPSGPTTEAGGQATFTVVLNSQPSANVAIGLSSSDTTEGTVAPTSLTFTTANWNAAQTVTVTGVDDAIADGNVVFSIVTAAATSTDGSYNGLDATDVSITNVDSDVVGISVSSASGSTSEGGAQATFTVVLDSEPTADVTIGLSSSDTSEGTVSPTSLTFTTANWNAAQTVTVTGQDDPFDDGDVVYTVVTAAATSADPNYSGLDAADVSITNTNDDFAFIVVAPTAGLVTTEAGSQANLTVVLNAEPTATVSMGLTSTDTSEGTVSPTSLTFTTGNWDTPQAVTVTGVDDAIADGNVVYSMATAPATSADPAYNGITASVFVTNIDDDTAGFTIVESDDSTVVTESPPTSTDTFTVVLTSEPLSNVVLQISSADTGEATVSPGALTFTPSGGSAWNVPQTVTVTGGGSGADDGDQLTDVTVSVVDASSDDAFDGVADQIVEVTTIDID